MTKEHAQNRDHVEDGLTELSQDVTVKRWKKQRSRRCADLAADILRRDGSAVDAAITGMLCSGVVQPESSGIGGGGFMTIRLSNGSVYALNFRETAPLAAHEDMFHSNASLARKVRLHPNQDVHFSSGYVFRVLFIIRPEHML